MRRALRNNSRRPARRKRRPGSRKGADPPEGACAKGDAASRPRAQRKAPQNHRCAPCACSASPRPGTSCRRTSRAATASRACRGASCGSPSASARTRRGASRMPYGNRPWRAARCGSWRGCRRGALACEPFFGIIVVMLKVENIAGRCEEGCRL